MNKRQKRRQISHRPSEKSTKAIKAAYGLGLLDGEARLQKKFNLVQEENNILRTANHYLAKEVRRFDKIDGHKVLIDLKLAAVCIGALKKDRHFRRYREKLEKILEKAPNTEGAEKALSEMGQGTVG